MAKVAKKAWLRPCLLGFTRPHFPGKPGQKPRKPCLASLCRRLPIRVCAAQRGRDFEAPDLERGIKNCGSRLYLLLKIVADYEEASI